MSTLEAILDVWMALVVGAIIWCVRAYLREARRM